VVAIDAAGPVASVTKALGQAPRVVESVRARIRGRCGAERRQRMSMIQGDLDAFGGEDEGSGASLSDGVEGGDDALSMGALALKTAPNTSATAITREQRRSRRKREIRARTISVKRMTKRELEIGRMLYP